MVQWWEHSPPTNVSWVRFPDPAAYVGWVCCWFFYLLREVFLRVSRFSPLLKNQHFQIPIRSGIVKHFIMSLWLGWLRKHSMCLTLNLHLHFFLHVTRKKAFCTRALWINSFYLVSYGQRQRNHELPSGWPERTSNPLWLTHWHIDEFCGHCTVLFHSVKVTTLKYVLIASRIVLTMKIEFNDQLTRRHSLLGCMVWYSVTKFLLPLCSGK